MSRRRIPLPPSAAVSDGWLVPARSWRRAVLAALLGGHLLGAIALLYGHGLLAVALVLPSHLLVWWGTLMPGSCLLGPVVRRFEASGRQVWLTIDDGPSADTPAMLDLLDRHRARATFFLIGAHAEAYPHQVRAIIERGHSIGNHSQRHSAGWFWALPPASIAAEIDAAQATLSRLAGAPPRLFRAVVGMANPFVAPRLDRHGLMHVGWSARAFDSRLADPARVWARLQRDLSPGAIVLLHEGAAHGRSVETLGHVLDRLDALGYRCVLPQPARSGTSAAAVPALAATAADDVTG
jgi:peptidoglycan-N-acetylglucosamine deacetylase